MKNFYVTGYNGLQLYCTEYANVQNPKAVVLVIHGMREHSGRYVEFAKTLNKAGFIVITSDSRGHGKTMKDKSEFGFGEKDIYAESVQDQLNIIEHIKQTYPTMPIYLFGHSYGSMLSQKILQVSPDLQKIILCGTNYGNNISYASGKIVSNIFKFFGQDKKPAKFFENISLDGWGKKFEHSNWLSRDNEVFFKYKEDPFCNGSFPISFYRSLFTNMTRVNKGIKDIDKNKKILLIVGSKDPVSNGGKLVEKLHKTYQKHGINSKLIIYPDARHELINETNKKEVYKDILEFVNE